MGWKGDVLDQFSFDEPLDRKAGPVQRIDHGGGDLVKGLRPAGAAVEDARSFAIFEQPEIHRDGVVHVNEVAPLLSIAITVRTCKQSHAGVGLILLEGLQGDRMHLLLFLVRLVGAVNVEIAQSRDLRGALLEAPSRVLVEKKLRVGVDIERVFVLARFDELPARAVYRRGRGINERDLLLLTPIEQRLGVLVVVLHHAPAVGLHGVGVGTLVQQHVDRAVEMASGDSREKVALVQVVLDLEPRKVLHLLAVFEVVHRDDLANPLAVKRLYEPRADEARRAGDDVVAHRPPNSSAGVTTAVPNFVTLMPPARLAMRTADSRPSPAASITASVAITVSPAPVTSDTSRFSAFTWNVLLLLKRVMPSSPRASSTASRPSLSRSCCARCARSLPFFQRPTTSRSSARFGVTMEAPL